ncbi:glycosyltransferase family 2 protein [Halosimplex salinum]|uniref:glycosyltransferase family 2 protein n=1 Tax=Halosimplex salinum TaxID=1710538 RepID=UPI0013DDE17C|nr:glycosyltransferase family A protein [Halosimplex salinum]
MIADSSVALGVPVYERTEKLRNLLESAGHVPIDTVYVADNGHTEEREAVYDTDYEFDLVVLDVEYDSGLGNCRRTVVDSLEEDYLVIADSDHTIPENVDTLVHQLEARPAFGGICGLLFEHGGLRGTCHDLYEKDDVLIRDIRGKDAELVAGQPLFEFDFLQNVAAFRRECVEEYAWDPNLQQGKPHLDFYVGHKRRTDWRFGCCPAVQFPHYPGGSSSYTANRNKRERLMDAREYFLDKWGYRQIVYGQLEWLETQDRLPSDGRVAELLAKRVLTRLPVDVQAKVTDARQFARRLTNRPPL